VEFMEEGPPECLVCGVALTANNPSMSANSRGKIKTKFRFECSEAGELAISARIFCRPSASVRVCTAGRGPAYYLPIAQQVTQLLLATFSTTEEGGHPQQPDDKKNSYDS
jgi:hypothetical protein